MSSLLPLLLLGAMMWLLLIRPQQQRVRRQQTLLAALELGDEVITAGGMFGRIVSIDGDRVSVEVSPGVVIVLLRGAITQRLTGPDEPDGELDEASGSDDL